jgi:L-threonylcarbamoyladenylate synthase
VKRIRAADDSEREAAIAAALDVIRTGGVVAYPTDTLYGLAVDPRSEDAVKRVFDVKGRDSTQAIPLIASDMDQARLAGRFTLGEMRLARRFWPGPLSLVVEADRSVSRSVSSSDGTVAIRVPAHPVARALAAAFGFCITATSANLSGQPSTASPDAVAASLGDRVDLLIDGGDAPGGAASTIVAMGPKGPVLIRAGAIAWSRVLESLQ